MKLFLSILTSVAIGNGASLSVINNMNQNDQNTNYFNKNLINNSVNKIELPPIDHFQQTSTDCCYQIADQVFLAFESTKISDKDVVNLYYINLQNINDIKIKNFGVVPGVSDGFYFETVKLSDNCLLFYRENENQYTIVDINNLEKPVVVTNLIPKIMNVPRLKTISLINQNQLIIETIDNLYLADVSDANKPSYSAIAIPEIEVFESIILLNANNFLVTGLINSPNGLVPTIFKVNIVAEQQPIVTKLALDLSQFQIIQTIITVNQNVAIISLDKNLYCLNLKNLNNPILINLEIPFQPSYSQIATISDSTFLVTIENKETTNQQLFLVDISDLKAISKKLITPPALENIKAFFSLVYLQKNQLFLRVIHNQNQIISYFLDLSNLNQPVWTDTKIGSDNILWEGKKLSNNAVLLNDPLYHLWYVTC